MKLTSLDPLGVSKRAAKKFLYFLGRHLFPHQIEARYQRRFHPFSKLPLSRGDVTLVVDVGAYSGSYSLRALEYYPNCSVIAFEPSSENYILCQGNMPSGVSSRITILRAAVSSKPGQLDLNLTSYGPSHSIEPQSIEHQRENPHVFETGKETVQVVTLDLSLPSESIIDVLKIDVEGHELNVLHGACDVLARTRYLIIEISLARDASIADQNVFKLFAFVRSRNFSLYSIIDLHGFPSPEYHLGMAQFDAIFKNTLLS